MAQARALGDISAANLTSLATAYGLDYLPYPLLGPPIHHRSATIDRPNSIHPDVADAYTTWIQGYRCAETWVTARTFPSDPQLPGVRIVGFRDAEASHVATQQDDTITAERVSVGDFEYAIAAAISLTAPGTHRRTNIEGLTGYFSSLNPNRPPQHDDWQPFTVLETLSFHRAEPEYPAIPKDHVAAFTIIQAVHGSPNDWGVDWAKPAAVIAHTCDEQQQTNDYLYTPDYTSATPCDRDTLTARISTLTAHDSP